MAYAMLLCLPYVWWSSVYEKDLFDKLQFVMAGLEEALTTTIDGIAKLTDKSLWAQYTKEEKSILNLLKGHMGNATVKQSKFLLDLLGDHCNTSDANISAKFSTYEKVLEQLLLSKRFKTGHLLRRFFQGNKHRFITLSKYKSLALILIAGTYILAVYYIISPIKEFNCEVDWVIGGIVKPAVLW